MKKKRFTSIIIVILIFVSSSYLALANDRLEAVKNAVATPDRESAGMAVEVDSNKRKNWPKGPIVSAPSAVLMDIDSGVMLYEKAANEKLYPASITKILTAYIACTHTKRDTKVVFSHAAVYDNMEAGSANMGFKEGEEITMDQALRCMMVASANEVANVIAETVSGSNEEFAKLMNKTAKELGCKDCNFVTPSGLHDDNHYVTAKEYAVICAKAYSNKWFREVCAIPSYNRPITNLVNDPWIQTNKHQMFRETENYYPYCTGGKVGGTDQAHATLVTYAEKDEKKFVCVLLYSIGGTTFPITKQLFEYGFNECKNINLEKCPDKYKAYALKTKDKKKVSKKPTIKKPVKKSTVKKPVKKTTNKKTVQKHEVKKKVNFKDTLNKFTKEIGRLSTIQKIIIIAVLIVIIYIIIILCFIKSKKKKLKAIKKTK